MEEELSFLRRKVNRLEDMIFNINDKIGLILEKFLNHRASHVAGIREVLQVEEDICLSLVTQLKSCIINSSSSSNRLDDNRTSGGKKNPVPGKSNALKPAPVATAKKLTPTTSVPLPRVVLTRQSTVSPAPVPQMQSMRQRTKATSSKKRRRVTDDEVNDESEPDPEQDPLIYLEGEESASGRQNLFTIKVETEQQQVDVGFQPEDGGLDLEQAADDAEGQTRDSDSDYGPCNSSNEEDDAEDSDKDDPDCTTRSGSGTTLTNPHPYPKKAYVLSRSFASLDEARSHIKPEDQFHMHSRKYTSLGTKLYYRCRHDARCPVRMHLVVNEKTGTVEEYLSSDPPPHSHRKKVSKKPEGLATEVKAVVDEIYLLANEGGDSDMNGTVDKLQEELIRRGFEEGAVPKHQIKNYVARLKKRKYGDLSFMRRHKRKPAKRKSTSTNSERRST